MKPGAPRHHISKMIQKATKAAHREHPAPGAAGKRLRGLLVSTQTESKGQSHQRATRTTHHRCFDFIQISSYLDGDQRSGQMIWLDSGVANLCCPMSLCKSPVVRYCCSRTIAATPPRRNSLVQMLRMLDFYSGCGLIEALC